MIDDVIPDTISEFPNAKEELSVALEAFKIGMERTLDVCFPACVYSYDRTTHTAEVMPLIKQAYFNGEYQYIRRKPYRVTVRNIQCGGVTIDFPVYVGDTGWVISSDRDTTLIKQNGALTASVLEGNRDIRIVEDDYQAKPNQPILHSFRDGFFIPDNWGMWENWRYKDNPSLAIGDAIYIGNSFDTKEERTSSSDRQYQEGNAYEKNSSASIVLTKNGTVAMASSKAKEKATYSAVETSNGTAKIVAQNAVSRKSAQIVLDEQNGITIRQDDESSKTATICNISQNGTTLTMVANNSSIQISLKNGEINIASSGAINVSSGAELNLKAKGDMNISSTQGDVNVTSAGNANVAAQGEVSVVGGKAVNINAGGDVNIATSGNANISAAGHTYINSAQSVDIASAGLINAASKDGVNIITAGNTTVMSKEKSAKILVTTLSKESSIEVVAEGAKSNVSVTLQESESKLSFVTEKKKSPIEIITKAESSPISINAKDKSEITIQAGSDSSVSIEADKNINITTIKGDINATINGNLSAQVKGDASTNVNGDMTADIDGMLNAKTQKTASITAQQNANIIAGGIGTIRANSLVLAGNGASVKLENGKTTIEGTALSFLGKDIYLENAKYGDNVKYTNPK